jgi:hypothetical protein
MRMTTLATLHRSMLNSDIDIQKFPFKTGAASFECLFSARGNILELSLTSRGENPKFFIFPVSPSYDIQAYLGDKLDEFISVLKTHGMSGAGFKPSEMFSSLDAAIPTVAKPVQVPSPEEIVRLRHDLEFRELPYFDTWIYWKQREGPSSENQKKTLLVLGSAAAGYSSRMTASSKWSANPTGRSWKQK